MSRFLECEDEIFFFFSDKKYPHLRIKPTTFSLDLIALTIELALDSQGRFLVQETLALSLCLQIIDITNEKASLINREY